MIGKASVITHGANAVRYSADKNMAEIVKVNNMPETSPQVPCGHV